MMGLALPLRRLRLRLPCSLHIQHIVAIRAQWFFYISLFALFRFVLLLFSLALSLSLQLNTIAAAQRKQWKWIAYAALPKPKRKRKNHICAHYCHGSIAVFVHKFALAGHTNAQHHRATIEIYAESFFFSFFIWSVFESVLVNRSDLPPVRLFFSVLFISRTRLRLNFSQCQTVNWLGNGERECGALAFIIFDSRLQNGN